MIKIDENKWITMDQAIKEYGEKKDTIWHRVRRMQQKGMGAGILYWEIPHLGITLVPKMKKQKE